MRERVPGDPTQILVAPEAAFVNEASGSVPHPRGLIRVRVARGRIEAAACPGNTGRAERPNPTHGSG